MPDKPPLTPDVFSINTAELADALKQFIRESMENLRRDGIVCAVSGGLDSSTAAALCSGAVGRDKVTALLLPERQGSPAALDYGRQIAEHLGIRHETIDISPVLSRLGTYNFITSYIPFRKFREFLITGFLKSSKKNIFLDSLKGDQSRLFKKGFSVMNTKHRVRLVVTCLYAESRNLMVAGSAHKSEDMVGLFTKFGVDDNADIMPMKNLYRSHILQLAEHLGIPDEIIGRTPNPEIIPGVEDKYRDVLALESGTADLVLYGFEHGYSQEEISRQTGIPLSKVEEIRDLIAVTEHMRNKSMAPDVSGLIDEL